MDAKIGQKILKILPPSDVWWAWVSEGTIVEITDKEIVCNVLVDCAREMKFDRNTGKCIAGTGAFIIARD